MFGRSLTTRLITVIATVTTVGVVMVSGAVAWSSYRNEERDAVAQTRAGSAYLSSQVESVLGHAVQVTSESQALITHEITRGGADRKAVMNDLREALRRRPDLYGTWFISEDEGFDGADAAHRGEFGSTARGVFSPYWRRNADGRLVQDRLGAGRSEFGDRRQPFYREPIRRDDITLIEPFTYKINEGQGPALLMGSVGMPVRLEGRLAGVVGVDFLLEHLSARLKGAELQEGQEFALVSSGGRVVAASDSSRLGAGVGSLGLEGHHLAELRSETGHVVTDWIGRRALVVSHPVKLEGIPDQWTLYVAIPTSVALANARNNALTALFFGFVAICLAMLIAWRLGDSLSKPVVVMARTMRRMAEGDLDVPTPKAHPSSELGDMATALEAFRTNARERLEAESARRAAEKTARDRSEFLAVMSHEIRTPMNGVLGMADALARTQLAPDQRQMLTVLTASGSTLLGLLNDILDFSKIESGRFEIDLQPFSLNALVRDVTELFRTQAEGKGVALTVNLPTAAPPLMGDAPRIRQVLHNLMSNAVKFTHAGSIKVDVGVRAMGAKESELVVEVADSGIGISDETQRRLFQKFVQGDASTTRAYGGTGLGLAISRELARLMGGDISVQSQPGKGAVFTVTLRLPHAEAAAAEDQVVQPAADAGGDQAAEQPLRILVAEDNPTNRQVMQIILDMLGAAVTFAQDGAEAVQHWSRNDYDIVLMDVQMPIMDGMTATREIRAREKEQGGRRLPIVAVTANAMAHHVDDCLAAGMDAHVSKPIRANELFETMTRLLNAEQDAAPAEDAAAA
jgi:signal transduction histidine kinase/ActR/RegA family two-component response regulator